MDDRTQIQITDAVRKAFASDVDDGRYVDVSRIPLICQSIISIDKKLDNLVTQSEFWPVKTLVYGMVGIMLTAMVAALVGLVIMK